MAGNIFVSRLNTMKNNQTRLPNNPLNKLGAVSERLVQSTQAPMSRAPVASVNKPNLGNFQKPMSVDPRIVQTTRPTSNIQTPPAPDQRPMSIDPARVNATKSMFMGFQGWFVNPLDRLKTTTEQLIKAEQAKPFLNLQGDQFKIKENNKVQQENGVAILKQYKAVGDLIADTYKWGWMEDEEINKLYPEFKDKLGSARWVMTEVYDAIANGEDPDFVGMKQRYPDLFQAKQKELPYKNVRTQEEYKKIDKESKKIWDNMSNINAETLSNNGKEYRWLMKTLSTIPSEIRSKYRVPKDISDTELTTFVVSQDPELKSEYDRITKLRLTGRDQALMKIGGSWRDKMLASIQIWPQKASEFFNNLSEEFRATAQDINKESNNWMKPVTAVTQGILDTGKGIVGWISNATTALTKLTNKDYDSISDFSNDLINVAGGVGETTLNAAFPWATTAFNAAGSTETGEKTLKNTIGLIPEGINNILQNTPGVQQWYESLDESGKAYLTNGLTMAVLHKANTATKDTQFNAKMALGVVKDGVKNAVQRGWSATKFQAWVEKGLKNVETGKYQEGALGRVFKEWVKETTSALKENFSRYDEVLNQRRQQVNTLKDGRSTLEKVQTEVKNDINNVKSRINQVGSSMSDGINGAVIGVKKTGTNLLEGTKKVNENIIIGTKNIVGEAKWMFKKNKNTVLSPETESHPRGGIKQIADNVADTLSKPFNYGAEKIAERLTSTSSAQDKLFKAQNPSLNRLGRKDKSYEVKKEKANRANELIVERGYLPKNAEERMNAHRETMKALWDENIWRGLKEKANVMVDANEIADAMQQEIAHYGNGQLLSVHKNDYKRAMQDIANLRKMKSISISDAENYKQQINMAVDWNNNPTAGEVYQKALRGATRKIGEIEDRIISEIPGEFAQFKKDYGALKDGMEDVTKAYLKEAKRNGMGIMESYGRFEGLGDVLTAFTSGKPHNIVTGIGKIVLGKAYGRAKDINFLIEKWFKQLAKEHTKRTVPLKTKPFPALPQGKATVVGKNWPMVNSPISPTPKVKNKDIIEIDKRPKNIVGLKTTKKTWSLDKLGSRKERKKDLSYPKQTWEGDFWPIYKGIKGAEAENFLIKHKKWEIEGAYTYKWEPVDLVRWEYDEKAEKWFWLSKIAKKHPEVLGKIQGLLDILPEVSRTDNRIKLDDGKYHITVSLNWKWKEKKWVLTAFEIWRNLQQVGGLPTSMLLRQFNSSGSPESIMKKNEKSNLLAPIMNKEISGDKMKNVWLFDAKKIKSVKQRDGLNPDVLPLSKYKEMQKLEPLVWALKRKDFKDYITERLTLEKGWKRGWTDTEGNIYIEVSQNIEDMLYSLDKWEKTEANKYAERIIPWKTADEIVSEYTKEYDSDLQLLDELDKKYPEFYNWKLNLWGVSKQKNTMIPEKPKKILWSLPESLKKKESFETLPEDVDLLEESKKIWPKRIAPDRKAHQQLNPQTALEKLAEQEKTRLTWKIKGLKEDLATLDKLVEKYGQKMPARTEKNRQKYPDLIKDYGLLQSLKKKYQTSSINDTRDIIENIISLNTRSLEGITPEAMKKAYIALVQEDISKGYKYPEAVLDFVPEARKILNGRERYEKGLYTSFSAKDERINYEYKEELGAGMKRQDGKELTQEQKQDIIEGVKDFEEVLGLDMKKLGEEKNRVYVHLNGKNVFLKNGVAGLYRERGENISISVGGIETVRQPLGGDVSSIKVHTVMAHELGHALDAIQNWNLFPSTKLFDLKIKMNKAPNWNVRYWKSDAEVTARAIEQYISIKKGDTDYYDKPAYWKKEVFENIIGPMVKDGIEEKFEGYMKWDKHSKPLPKTTQD